MAFSFLKSLLPDQPKPVCIWRGPFRGARVVMNPRTSVRKILGVYEHELNDWIDAALHRVVHVVDVGANDGYFTFGCAAAFRRLAKVGEIVAFEPQTEYFGQLQQSLEEQSTSTIKFTLVQSLVGQQEEPSRTTLDSIQWIAGNPNDRRNTLIKIDVEGAEEEVLKGGGSWLNSSNLFLIEVHREQFLTSITQLFADKGLVLDRVNQRPLSLIGGEVRTSENWWLVSRLNPVP